MLALLGLTGCVTKFGAREPIVIGYVGGLSGRAASLGIAGRDGALLAVEEVNRAGGIAGRQVRLETFDDGVGPTAAADGVKALAEKGAVAIVGPMTSAAAVAAAPVADAERIVLMSPTVSTDSLTGKNDYFLRAYPDNASAATLLATKARKRLGPVKVAVIYDLANKAHTQSWYQHFSREFISQGGSVADAVTFVSGENPDYTRLAEASIDSGADCVFLLANAIDTAMLAQRIRAAKSDVPILASEWSATDDLVEAGGVAVDGVLFLATHDRSSTASKYVRMKESFKTRFGYEPGFAATHAYDVTRMLLAVVDERRDASDIRSELVSSGEFPGVQAPIRIDQFGDVLRPYYLMTVSAGEFKRAVPR
jgi:branched-chain amino acid transport system substrate-binding protein